jgi:hypothetical protein
LHQIRLQGQALGAIKASLGVTDIPGSEKPNEDWWAFCLDQLGNALQFNLRTGDPPEVSRHDDQERQAWVKAIYDYQ